MSDASRPAGKSDDQLLRQLGYEPELARRMSGFSNFAISLSIICILAGGITSFHVGLGSVGGASLGIGWPLACLFSLAVAGTMAQVASAFPTAGGLYHWGSILGGRGCGWATAWFNLAGLITVLATVNAGTYDFALAALRISPPEASAGCPFGKRAGRGDDGSCKLTGDDYAHEVLRIRSPGPSATAC